MTQPPTNSPQGSTGTPWSLWTDAASYWVDAWQRSILYLDVMRQRGNQFHEHMAERAPHVLSFRCELVLSGATLPRPVNYGLVRITPPPGVTIDPKKRPFVVVDPRAGHGPGIGGFKADSEVGVAMRAGHACYFVGFLPDPVPGQTVEDVMRAEAAFLERVIELHPEAEGKPVVIGNCQAGWQMMMTAATRPELFGPIIIAGAPLSYWNGVRGVNPMRYSGGLMGGSWLTALTGDMGHGIFDGAWLAYNFESLNPANTLWTKQYNLYANIDTEAARYLGFERWWGGHVLLNAEEMQYIVDNLFVGNKLSTAQLVTADGMRIDLREIRSPIIVFCSKGDNITPPQQALGWITDLYSSIEDIRAHGQTIVYCVHESVGHLGIFVSGSRGQEGARGVRLQHRLHRCAAAWALRGRDHRPRGRRCQRRPRRRRLCAPLRRPRSGRYPGPGRQRAGGRAPVRHRGAAVGDQSRPLPHDDAALREDHGGRADGRVAAPRAPVAAPVRAVLGPQPVHARACGPGAGGPAPAPAGSGRQCACAGRARGLGADREGAWMVMPPLRDQAQERLFLAAYGSPLLQALVGLKATDELPRRRPGDEPEHREFVARRVAELRGRIAEGGLDQAALRALVYIGLAERDGDERTFNMLQRIREERGGGVDLATFKQALRDQFLMLLLDPRGGAGGSAEAAGERLGSGDQADARGRKTGCHRRRCPERTPAGRHGGDRGDFRAGGRPCRCRRLAGGGRRQGCQGGRGGT